MDMVQDHNIYEAIKIHDILTLLHVAINKLLEKSLSLLNSIYSACIFH